MKPTCQEFDLATVEFDQNALALLRGRVICELVLAGGMLAREELERKINPDGEFSELAVHVAIEGLDDWGIVNAAVGQGSCVVIGS